MLIAIEGMEFYGYHGYYEAEQIIGNNYQVDVYVTLLETIEAGKTDELKDTFNYNHIYQIAKKIITETKSKLLEHLAQQIIDNLHNISAFNMKVKVRVSKINPPFESKVQRTYVEIEKKLEKNL